MRHQGSCHCGAVAFEVEGEFADGMTCNCSYCRRAGHILAFTTADRFRLRTPQAAVSTYLFNKQAIRHNFCAACGIATHGGGVGPDGKEMAAINLRCLPNLDLAALKLTKFDGAAL
jgi:hypothetical protein